MARTLPTWAIVLIVVASCAVLLLCLAAWYISSLFKGPDYSALPAYYPFKSRAAEQRYHEYYAARAREWPSPSEERLVQTSFGRTFVRVCGPKDAPRLVLLPSVSASSLIWLPNIEGLAPHFRIYAVDNIYDVGLSVNTRPVKGAADLTAWLDELFTKLELGDRINLMGLSFGGWLAAQYALVHEERLAGLVMVAPVATVHQLPGQWAWRAIMAALPPHRFFMTHFLVNWMCQGLVKKGDDRSKRMLERWVDDAIEAMECFSFRMPVAPTVLTDDQLRSFRVPALFLVGANEVIYPADRAVQRIKSVAPSIATDVIPNASHDLTISQTELVNGKVTAFLLNVAASAGRK